MKQKRFFLMLLGWCALLNAHAQQVNDNNTPLHLMKPAYQTGYGIPEAQDVKLTIDRVLQYIEAETPAALVDKRTGKAVELTVERA